MQSLKKGAQRNQKDLFTFFYSQHHQYPKSLLRRYQNEYLYQKFLKWMVLISVPFQKVAEK